LHPGLRGVQQAASRTTGHPLALNAPYTHIGIWSFLFGPPVSATARRPRRLSTSSPRRRLGDCCPDCFPDCFHDCLAVCFTTYCSLPNFGRSRQEQLCRTDARQPSIRPDMTSRPIRSYVNCRMFLSGSARIGKTAIASRRILRYGLWTEPEVKP